MILQGTIELYGAVFTAFVDIGDDKKYSRARAYELPNGKWRAFKTVDGRQKAYGCHDTKDQALDAARLERAPARAKKLDALGIYLKKDDQWRVRLSIGGKHVALGEYVSWGHAVLVRDVVARRSGLKPHVVDYEMPLAFVSHAVARSYISDAVMPPGMPEIAEFQRRVDELNEGRV